jgi:ABC-type amino acid transport substrate-binding protein
MIASSIRAGGAWQAAGTWLAAGSWLAAGLTVASPALAAEPLRVCLTRHTAPLSDLDSGQAKGFDVALSGLIAERLGRPLAIQWFISRNDPDSNPPLEASALMSDGHCALLAGYPLMAGTLRQPAATGKLPPYQGSTSEDRHRLIKLEALVPTRPYRFDALTVVLSPAHRDLPVHRLADVSGLRLGVEIHTLADLIAMHYEQGRLADQVLHFVDPASLFRQLQDGQIDGALVDLHEFDAWRAQHPDTKIAVSGYTHSIGFNIGFVGITTDQALVTAVSGIISDLVSHDALRPLGEANGLTWLPPRSPEIAPSPPLAAFGGD